MSGKGKASDYQGTPAIQSRDLPRNWVPRPRLDEVLNGAVAGDLTLLVAPAGTGKSVMLRGWAARAAGTAQATVHWVSGRAQPGLGGQLTLSQALDAATRRQTSDRRHVVVVDDADQVSSADLARIVAALSDQPPGPHLILASRRDLALPLVRLKLSGTLTEIRADQLLFTDEEAEALITAHAPGSSDMDVLTVRERGRGWAAALVLGARAVSGASDRAAARRALAVTEQPVLDYLLGEVFDTLDARTCHVLLCTCATETVDADDAVAMSADPDAVALLSRLAAEGMLVVASSGQSSEDDWPRTFTYHPLLIELLRRRVRAGASDHALHAAAQVRIVQYHLAHGDPIGALRYATRHDDPHQLVRLLCEHGVGLLVTGHAALLDRALDAVPDQLENEYPTLVALRALERQVAGDTAAATRLATEAIRAAEEIPADRPPIDGGARNGAWKAEQFDQTLVDATLILRCWLARIGIGSNADAVARARQRLGCDQQVSSRHQHVAPRTDVDATQAARGWLLTELGVAETWLGDLESARVHIDASLAIAHALNDDLPVAVGLGHLSVIDWATEGFTAADSHAQDAVLLAEALGAQDESFVARARIVRAWVAMQQLDFVAAQRQLASARSFLAREHDSLVEVGEHLVRGYLLLLGNEIANAQAHLESFPSTPEPLPMFIEVHLAVQRAWSALAAGDGDGIKLAIRRLQGLNLRPHAEVVRAVALDLRGQTQEALGILGRLAGGMNALAANPTSRITASAYRAGILLRDGHRDEARFRLRELLAGMTPHQRLYVSGVATMPGMAELLTEEAADPTLSSDAARQAQALIAMHIWLPVQGSSRAAEPARPIIAPSEIDLRDRAGLGVPQAVSLPSSDGPLVVDLTARERDVLRELALGGSYADIAQVLYITENTVKTHLAALYRKLGATRRADALRSARQAGLLNS